MKGNSVSARHLRNRQHDRASEGGDDLKKMKDFRSAKASNLDVLRNSSEGCKSIQMNKSPNSSTLSAVGQADCLPNYMKATRCSTPMKDRLQVPLDSLDTTSSSFSSEKIKNASTLALQCINMNPKRPSKMKTSRMPPLPKKNIDTATCSWALKDSKIKKTRHLNPGGTESEKASILKVCRSPYCSLNGHKPPPFKYLLAQRQSLMTQKSIALRKAGMNGVKGRENAKNVMQSNPSFISTPRMEEKTDGSRSASRKEQSTQEAINGELSKIRKTSSMEYDEASCEEEASNLLAETCSDISYLLDLDQGTDISAEQIDVFMNYLKYAKYDLRLNDKEEYGGWPSDYFAVNELETNSEYFAHSDRNILVYEATGMNCEQETWPCPEIENKDDASHANDKFSFYSEMTPGDEIAAKHNFPSEGNELSAKHNFPSEGNELLYKVHNAHDSAFLYNPEITFQDNIDKEFNYLDYEGSKFGYDARDFEYEETKSEEYVISSCSADTGYLTKNTDESSSHCSVKDALEKCNLEYDGHRFRHEDEVSESNNHSGAKDADECHANRTVESTEVEEDNGNNKTEATQTQQSRRVETDRGAKIIDLRQTAKKERKIATEWMTDYAIQKVVTKLAPAQKRKVALLVEAFESVIPLAINL